MGIEPNGLIEIGLSSVQISPTFKTLPRFVICGTQARVDFDDLVDNLNAPIETTLSARAFPDCNRLDPCED